MNDAPSYFAELILHSCLFYMQMEIPMMSCVCSYRRLHSQPILPGVLRNRHFHLSMQMHRR